MCHGQGCRAFLGMGDLPPFNRNPYNGYINSYYWVDDHPLLYGNNGSLDPGTYNSTRWAPSPYTLVINGAINGLSMAENKWVTGVISPRAHLVGNEEQSLRIGTVKIQW